MSSTVCSLCTVERRVHGWGWTEEVGLHSWQEPTKAQIAQRLRERYEKIQTRDSAIRTC